MKFLVSCVAITAPRVVLGAQKPTQLSECLLFIRQAAKCDAETEVSTVPQLHKCSSHHKILAGNLAQSCQAAEALNDTSEKFRICKQLHNMLGDEAEGMSNLKNKWTEEVKRIQNIADSSKLLAEGLKEGSHKDRLVEKSNKLQESLGIAKEAREKVDQENKAGLNISADAFYDVVQQMRTCKKLYVKAKDFPEFKTFQQKCAADTDLQEYEERNEKNLASQKMFTDFLKEKKAEYHDEDNVGVRVLALKALHKKCEDIQGHWETKIAKLGELFDDEKVTCETGDLKKMDRCQAKFFYKYHGNGKGLSDINRASIILPSVDGIIDAVKTVDKFFAKNKKKGGILRMKNRFMDAKHDYLDAGYSDILLNVEFEGIICEVQIHLQSLVNIKKGIDEFGVKNDKMKGHKAYKVARRFSENFEKVCFEGYDAKPQEAAIDETLALLAKPVLRLSRHNTYEQLASDKTNKDLSEAATDVTNSLTKLLKSEKLEVHVESRRRLMDRLALAEACRCERC